MKILFSLLSICCFLGNLNAQDKPITLRNPSFEGSPHIGSLNYVNRIAGWFDCGLRKFPSESPPDLHMGGEVTQFFKVKSKAQHGNTYMGMVVRDNDTWESVSQSLSAPLVPGQCYEFSLYLSKSEEYRSPARRSGILIEEAINKGISVDSIDHIKPCVLRIWGGTGPCQSGQTELLAETNVVTHERWIKYDFKLEPKQTHYFITLEAFVKAPSLFPYNGHILLDNLSDLVPIPCDTPEPIVSFTKPGQKKIKSKVDNYYLEAKMENVYSESNFEFLINGKKSKLYSLTADKSSFKAKVKLKPGENKFEIRGKNDEGEDFDEVYVVFEPVKEPAKEPVTEAVKEPIVIAPKPKVETKLLGIERKELKKEQTLEIKDLRFDADSDLLQARYHSILDEIYNFLASNADVKIEVGGHTNNRCTDSFCNELSEKRAKSVADYLVKKGIPSTQINYKGYGKTNPKATNKTEFGRKQNQRVEIKVLVD